MNLAQLMTTPAITALPDTPLPALLELLERHRISAVILAEEGIPLGLVTEQDVTRNAAEDRLYSGLTGRTLTSGKPITALPETSCREAFQLMVLSRSRHLVVVDSAGKAVGMVTETNFLHSLGLEYFVDLTTIKEVVARGLITLKPTDSVHAALEQMHQHNISCVPVADAEGRPVGILTERDVVRLSLRRVDFYHTRLQQVMSQPVCAVSEQAVLPDVVEILRMQQIRRLVIVDQDGRLTGLITETDLLKGLQSRYSRLLREIIHEQERQLRQAWRALDDQSVLRSLLESAPDTGIAATDLNLRILYFNPAAGRIYGCKPEEVIGRTVHEFHVLYQIPPERLDQAVKIVREQGFYQYTAQRSDGRHFELRVSAIRDSDNEMMGYMLIGQDVTRRKQAEIALQRSEERLRKSQQFARVGSWDWQIESDILHWSKGVPPLFGLPPGSMKISHAQFLEAVHPEDRQRLTEAVTACLERGTEHTLEYRVVWPDGSVHWLHEQGDVLRDEYGEPLNMLGLVQDISRRKEAELQLLSQHHFLDSVLETVPSMLFVKEAELLRYVRFNRAGELLTGRPASDFLGKSDADLLPPAEAEARMAADRQILSGGLTVALSEEEITTQHQGTRLLRTRKVPILDGQGKPVYLLGISDDITEQRAVEQSLAEARTLAEKANQAKSDFLANMSHEIRTPMNGIIGLTELALTTELTPQQSDYLEKVNESAQSLLGLLNDILDLSKIEAHRLELESIPFDLHALLGQISSLMAIHSQQKGLPLHVRIDPEIPRHLLGDPLRIKQILLNLVGNAFKFTRQGEITIEVRPGLHAQHDCLPVAFTVRDTGIGIAKRQQQELFKPFVQSDSSTTRLYGGTGLGLAITRQLVEMMDGTITLVSAPGEGSAFTFTLPLPLSAPEELAAYLKHSELASPDRSTLEQIRGAHILLVEDNAINQQVAMELLTQECFRVDLAENGEQALDLLQPGRYDLVLMDIQMPVMDGYQATTAIRRQSEYDSLPILAMSANAMRHDREQCRAVGMNDHIPKPVDRKQLLAALCRWIKPAVRDKPQKRQERHIAGKLPQLCGINSRVALERLGGNQRVYLSILHSFAREYPGAVREIRRQLAENERNSAERLAHTLKGMAGAIGAETLQETAKVLEDNIRHNQPLDSLLEAAEFQLEQVIVALQSLPPVDDKTTPINHQQINTALHLLEEQLRSYDASAAETLAGLLHMAQPDLRQQLATLQGPVERFDFEAALAVFPELNPGHS
ncbi:CBS domain-containing protein [Candidatus Electronema sp. PJ]|uniref:CBS domain-containing protein n=1 Tax=Candidatus Electronema sp. PJ TaxID=3401572 RepID=UPI003AA857DF